MSQDFNFLKPQTMANRTENQRNKSITVFISSPMSDKWPVNWPGFPTTAELNFSNNNPTCARCSIHFHEELCPVFMNTPSTYYSVFIQTTVRNCTFDFRTSWYLVNIFFFLLKGCFGHFSFHKREIKFQGDGWTQWLYT